MNLRTELRLWWLALTIRSVRWHRVEADKLAADARRQIADLRRTHKGMEMTMPDFRITTFELSYIPFPEDTGRRVAIFDIEFTIGIAIAGCCLIQRAGCEDPEITLPARYKGSDKRKMGPRLVSEDLRGQITATAARLYAAMGGSFDD